MPSLPQQPPLRTPWRTLFAINALACFARGYGFNCDDQHLTLPALKRLLDPTLYPNDFMFSKPLSDFSLYGNLLVFPAKLLGIETSFLVIYIAVTFAITVAMYKLAVELFGDRTSGIVAAAMLCGANTLAGTMRLQLFDYYLYPRTVSLAFGAFAYVYMVREQWERAALMAGLEFVIHPPSGLVTLTVLGACMTLGLVRGQVKLATVATSAAAFVLPASAVLVKMFVFRGGRGLEFFAPMDERWFRIIYGRMPYMFYASWPLSRYGQIALYGALFLLGRRSTAGPGRRVMLVAFWCAIGINVVNFVLRDSLRLPLFMQLHLEVSIKLFVLLALVHVGPYVWARLAESGPLVRAVGVALLAQLLLMRGGQAWLPMQAWAAVSTGGWVCCALLLAAFEASALRLQWRHASVALSMAALALWVGAGWDAALATVMAVAVVAALTRRGPVERERVAAVGCMVLLAALGCAQLGRAVAARRSFVAGLASYFAIPHLRPPSPYTALIDWMRECTPRSAMFLGSTDLSGLRYASERSYFVTSKDGGQALYSRDYAIEWAKRMALVQFIDRSNETVFRLAARRFGIDYVIGGTLRRLRLPIAFEDKDFVVYDLRPAR